MYTKEDVTRLLSDLKDSKSGAVAAPAKEVDKPTRYIGNRDTYDERYPVVRNPNLGTLDMSTLEIGAPYCFGLAVDAYDPVSGHVFSICRPHRADLPDHPEIFMTPGHVATHVWSLRTKKAHDDRALGIWPDADKKSKPAPAPPLPPPMTQQQPLPQGSQPPVRPAV